LLPSLHSSSLLKGARIAGLTLPTFWHPKLALGARLQLENPSTVVSCLDTRVIPTLEEVRVDMADMKVECRPVMLVTSVGSCVAICIHDSVNKCGGLAHIMLPESGKDSDAIPFKYAESAVPALLKATRKVGKSNGHFSAKIAGGADMFASIKCSMFKIGERNVQIVRQTLQANGIRLVAEDVGGTSGRRVSFNVVNGTVLVRSLKGEDKVL
jgi:chemotaxis protein CheD